VRPGPPVDWPGLEAWLLARHPAVRQIAPDALAAALDAPDGGPARPVLVDLRSAAEQAVSHLQGTRFATSVEDTLAIAANRSADTPIVVYCAVGVRACRAIDALQAAGHANVWHLRGSLFGWANAGRPLYRGRDRVQRVHPFDRRWQALLDPRLRAPLDER
jgi:rhodanese-related sulfurtransferase